jgi:hypothetical protein
MGQYRPDRMGQYRPDRMGQYRPDVWQDARGIMAVFLEAQT